ALAHQLAFRSMLEPGHRAPLTLRVDEGEHVLQVGPMVQVEELGDALGVVAGRRVGRDVVDLLVADPDGAPVVEGLQIVLAGSQHDVPPGFEISYCSLAYARVSPYTIHQWI